MRVFFAFVALYCLLAWQLRWHSDDLYFNFKAIDNLLEGLGFYYTPALRGADAYGQVTSNFLFAALMLPFRFFGMDVHIIAALVQLAFLPATLYCFIRLAQAFMPPFAVWLALLTLTANYTFFNFTTSGLGTSLQTFIVAALLWRLFVLSQHNRNSDIAALSALFVFASLTRPDVAVLCFPVWLAATYIIMQQENRVHRMLLLTMPALVIGGLLIIFKTWYYGSPVPLAYWAKASFIAAPWSWYVDKGVVYLSHFFSRNGFFFLLPLFALVFISQPPKLDKRLVLVAAAGVILAWSLYMVRIGGGYIEFRLMAPLMAPLMLLTFILFRHSNKYCITVAAAVLIASSHGAFITQTNALGLLAASPVTERSWNHAKVTPYEDRPMRDYGKWQKAGEALNRLFGDYNENVFLATTVGGALGYYSRSYTLEMHGWTDKKVVETGLQCQPRECSEFNGHLVFAAPEHLVERGINLIFGHPTVLSTSKEELRPIQRALIYHLLFPEFDHAVPLTLPDDSELVALPIDADNVILALYVGRNAYLDELFEREQVIRLPVYPDGIIRE